MGIQDRLLEDMKAAMKSGDKLRLGTIRMLRAQMTDGRIAKGADLTEQDEIAVLTSAVKKRREAIELFDRGGRTDLVDKEQKEIEVISQYLPKQLSTSEVEEVIVGVIAEVGAVGLKDLGKVMAEAMKELKGKADGRMVQELVRKKLA